MEGTVKWFDRRKGYGFIAGDDGKEYFVHYSALQKDTILNENEEVTFEPVQDDRGRKAQNVVKKGEQSEKGEQEEEKEEEKEE